MTLRRAIVISALLIFVPAALYTGVWHYVASDVSTSFDRWADGRRAAGWTLDWDSSRVAGFPGAIRLEIKTPRITLPSGVSWHSDRIGVKLSLRHSRQLRLNISGNHTILWNQRTFAVQMVDGRLIAQLEEDGDLADATLQAHRLSIQDQDYPPLTVKELAVTWDPLPVQSPTYQTPTVIFSATAHTVNWPGQVPLPLGGDISLIAVDGQVRGVIPPLPPQQAIRQWSDQGGIVDVKHAAIEWPPLAVSANGTMALDPQGQILAAFSSRLRGFDPLMDRLQDSGSLSADVATAAKAMFSLMSRPDPQGRPAVSVPFTIQDDVLSLGTTPIGRIPHTQW